MNRLLRLALRSWCKALHNDGVAFGSHVMRISLLAFRAGWLSCEEEIVYNIES